MNKSLHLEQKNIFENENVFKVYNSVFALFKFTQCMRKLFFSSIRIGVCKIFRIPTQLHKFGSATLIFFKQPSFCWNFPIPLFECFDVSKGFFLTPKVQNLEVSALGVYVLSNVLQSSVMCARMKSDNWKTISYPWSGVEARRTGMLPFFYSIKSWSFILAVLRSCCLDSSFLCVLLFRIFGHFLLLI